MFCPKCGSKVDDGAKFCTSCGSSLSLDELKEGEKISQTEPELNSSIDEDISSYAEETPAQEVSYSDEISSGTEEEINVEASSNAEKDTESQETSTINQSAPVNKPSQMANQIKEKASNELKKAGISKSALIGMICGGIVLFIIFVCIIASIFTNRRKKVDLNEAFHYEILGADGYGRVESGLSYGDLEDLILDALELDGNSDEGTMTLFRIDAIIDGKNARMSYEWDKTDMLSNGDEIHMTWDVDDDILKDEYDIVFTHSDITVTVEGLKEVTPVDVFEGVNVYFSGMSGEGYAQLDTSGSTYQDLSYSIDNESSLSNGDIVTVSVSSPDGYSIQEHCAPLGYMPKETSKSFTVEGLDEYLSNLSVISDSDMNTIKSEAESVLRAQESSEMGNDEAIDGFDYVGMYLLSEKNGTQEPHNKLYVVYTFKASNTLGKIDVIQYCEYENVSVSSSGLTIDFNNVKHPKETGWFEDAEGEKVYSGDPDKDSIYYYYYGYEDMDTFIRKKITAEENIYVSSFKG